MIDIADTRTALIDAHATFTAAKAAFESAQAALKSHTELAPELRPHAEALVGTIVTTADIAALHAAEDAYLIEHQAAVAFHETWLKLSEASNLASHAMTDALDVLERAKATYFNLLAPYTPASGDNPEPGNG